MNPEDLALKCVESINKAFEDKRTNPHIYAKIKHAAYKREYCFPLGKGSPKAEIIQWNDNGFDVVSFDAIDLLAFLVAKEGYPVTLERNEDEI